MPIFNQINKEIYKDLELLPLDLDGWNGNKPIFEKHIKDVQPTRIIEVGTWKGQSAVNMARIVKSLDLNCEIRCVDTWLGALEFWGADTPSRDLKLKNGYPQVFYQFLSNVVHKGMEDIIIPFPTTSEIAHRFFKKNNIMAQLIYIDASHEEGDVYRDIKNFYELLLPGGIIFGDDYNTSWPGVQLDVKKFSEEINIGFTVDNMFWSMRKPI